MPLAADYPFLDVLWTCFVIFAWFIWIMLLFRIFADLFRRHDIGGGTKTLWFIFVICLPFLGVFVYLISQSHHMAERDMKAMEDSQRHFDDYVKSVAGGSGAAAEIDKAKQLLDSGAITQTEFDAIKAKALAT